MIFYRFAAAAAGLSILFSTGLGAGGWRAPPWTDAREAAAGPLPAPARLVGAPPQQADPTVPERASGAKIAAVDLMPTGAIAPAAPDRVAAVDPALTGEVEPAAAPAPSASLATSPAVEPRAALDVSRLAAAAALYRKGDAAGAPRSPERSPSRCSASPRTGRRCAWPPIPTISAWRPSPRPIRNGRAATGSERSRRRISIRSAPRPPRSPRCSRAIRRARPPASSPPRAPRSTPGGATRRRRTCARCGATAISTPGRKSAVLKDFASALTRDDHKYRADRLLYAEKSAAALRAAGLAGPGEVALAEARIAAMRGPLTARAIGAVPAALQGDPGLLFARVQDARRANRALDAAGWLARAPSEQSALIDPDKWWSEQRMVARQLLDLGQAKKAFEICAAAKPATIPARIDADFHAGWIALRFLNDAPEAARRFAAASAIAETPLSIARAAYWQGRAAEAMGEAETARDDYERAARWPIAYYGQLAAARLGRGAVALRAPARIALGDARDEATRVVELLLRRRPRRSRHVARRGGGRALGRRGADRRARQGGGGPRRRDDQRRIRQDRHRARLRPRRDGVPDLRRACTLRRWRIRPTCRAFTRWRARRANSPGAPPRASAPRA